MIKHTFISHLLAASVLLGGAAALSGCASNSQIEEASIDAQQALQAAREAREMAQEALNAANTAQRTADTAEQCCIDNQQTLEDALQRMQQK